MNGRTYRTGYALKDLGERLRWGWLTRLGRFIIDRALRGRAWV
jgi:hypothetical protein